MNNIKVIEKKASLLVSEINGNKPRVDVEKIATTLGLEMKEHDLGSNVSGVLFIDKGRGIIGYNPNESNVRRRFTIAHELGHYILHRFDKELFVDHKQFKAVFRDHESSTGEKRQEREANAFAAALLMPKHLLMKEIEKVPLDLADDDNDGILELAKKFEVSTQAMAFRIANLNLF
jgi:Zn-dependent peptidase ImmA (M78 family)